MFKKVNNLNDLLCSLPAEVQTQQLLEPKAVPLTFRTVEDPVSPMPYSMPTREQHRQLVSEAGPSTPPAEAGPKTPRRDAPAKSSSCPDQVLETAGPAGGKVNAEERGQEPSASSKPGGVQAAEVTSESEQNGGDKQGSTLETSNSGFSEEKPQTYLVQVVNGIPFELTFGLLIVLNTLSMCAEAEYLGWGTGNKLGIHRAQATTSTGDKVFLLAEWFFSIAFTLEVVAKMVALELGFLKSGWNVFDLVVITFAWVESQVEIGLPFNPMLLRLVRLFRLLRLARKLSAYEVFDDLVLMIKGIKAGAPVLLWVVVLLLPITSCAAIAMQYALVEYIEDESIDAKSRLDCFNYFGTFSKAMLSMFEVTFANWVPVCRFLYNNVHSSYAVFFMAYQLVMKIAVLRVMYGVFLKVTFDCATSDDEAIIAKKRREDRIFADKMKVLMKKVDSSNDGYISRAEFEQIATDPRVRIFLSAMELDIHDASLVFELADDGDEKLSAEELAHALSVLKGTARSMDIWTLISLTRKVMDKMDTLVSLDTKIVQEVVVDSPKKQSFFASIAGDARISG